MNNYIDIKVTVWNRLFFTDKTDMKNIAGIIAQDDLSEIISDEYGFIRNETLYETDEYLTPEQNGQQPTIEVYADHKKKWNNSKNE